MGMGKEIPPLSICGTLSRIEYILEHKASLPKSMKIGTTIGKMWAGVMARQLGHRSPEGLYRVPVTSFRPSQLLVLQLQRIQHLWPPQAPARTVLKIAKIN